MKHIPYHSSHTHGAAPAFLLGPVLSRRSGGGGGGEGKSQKAMSHQGRLAGRKGRWLLGLHLLH